MLLTTEQNGWVPYAFLNIRLYTHTYCWNHMDTVPLGDYPENQLWL